MWHGWTTPHNTMAASTSNTSKQMCAGIVARGFVKSETWSVLSTVVLFGMNHKKVTKQLFGIVRCPVKAGLPYCHGVAANR